MSNGKSEAHGRVRRAVQQAREALQERFRRAQHKQSELMVKAREESALGMLKRSLLGKREKSKTAEAKLEEERTNLEALKEAAKKYSELNWRSSSVGRVKRRLEFRHAVKKAVPEELRGAFNHASINTAKDLVKAYEQNKDSPAFLEFLKFNSQGKRAKEAGDLRVVRAAYFAKEKNAEAKEYLFAKALEFEKRGQWKTFDKIAERASSEHNLFAFACELALEHAPENASQQRVEAVRNVVFELIENDFNVSRDAVMKKEGVREFFKLAVDFTERTGHAAGLARVFRAAGIEETQEAARRIEANAPQKTSAGYKEYYERCELVSKLMAGDSNRLRAFDAARVQVSVETWKKLLELRNGSEQQPSFERIFLVAGKIAEARATFEEKAAFDSAMECGVAMALVVEENFERMLEQAKQHVAQAGDCHGVASARGVYWGQKKDKAKALQQFGKALEVLKSVPKENRRAYNFEEKTRKVFEAVSVEDANCAEVLATATRFGETPCVLLAYYYARTKDIQGFRRAASAYAPIKIGSETFENSLRILLSDRVDENFGEIVGVLQSIWKSKKLAGECVKAVASVYAHTKSVKEVKRFVSTIEKNGSGRWKAGLLAKATRDKLPGVDYCEVAEAIAGLKPSEKPELVARAVQIAAVEGRLEGVAAELEKIEVALKALKNTQMGDYEKEPYESLVKCSLNSVVELYSKLEVAEAGERAGILAEIAGEKKILGFLSSVEGVKAFSEASRETSNKWIGTMRCGKASLRVNYARSEALYVKRALLEKGFDEQDAGKFSAILEKMIYFEKRIEQNISRFEPVEWSFEQAVRDIQALKAGMKRVDANELQQAVNDGVTYGVSLHEASLLAEATVKAFPKAADSGKASAFFKAYAEQKGTPEAKVKQALEFLAQVEQAKAGNSALLAYWLQENGMNTSFGKVLAELKTVFSEQGMSRDAGLRNVCVFFKRAGLAHTQRAIRRMNGKTESEREGYKLCMGVAEDLQELERVYSAVLSIERAGKELNDEAVKALVSGKALVHGMIGRYGVKKNLAELEFVAHEIRECVEQGRPQALAEALALGFAFQSQSAGTNVFENAEVDMQKLAHGLNELRASGEEDYKSGVSHAVKEFRAELSESLNALPELAVKASEAMSEAGFADSDDFGKLMHTLGAGSDSGKTVEAAKKVGEARKVVKLLLEGVGESGTNENLVISTAASFCMRTNARQEALKETAEALCDFKKTGLEWNEFRQLLEGTTTCEPSEIRNAVENIETARTRIAEALPEKSEQDAVLKYAFTQCKERAEEGGERLREVVEALAGYKRTALQWNAYKNALSTRGISNNAGEIRRLNEEIVGAKKAIMGTLPEKAERDAVLEYVALRKIEPDALEGVAVALADFKRTGLTWEEYVNAVRTLKDAGDAEKIRRLNNPVFGVFYKAQMRLAQIEDYRSFRFPLPLDLSNTACLEHLAGAGLADQVLVPLACVELGKEERAWEAAEKLFSKSSTAARDKYAAIRLLSYVHKNGADQGKLLRVLLLKLKNTRKAEEEAVVNAMGLANSLGHEFVERVCQRVEGMHVMTASEVRKVVDEEAVNVLSSKYPASLLANHKLADLGEWINVYADFEASLRHFNALEKIPIMRVLAVVDLRGESERFHKNDPDLLQQFIGKAEEYFPVPEERESARAYLRARLAGAEEKTLFEGLSAQRVAEIREAWARPITVSHVLAEVSVYDRLSSVRELMDTLFHKDHFSPEFTRQARLEEGAATQADLGKRFGELQGKNKKDPEYAELAKKEKKLKAMSQSELLRSLAGRAKSPELRSRLLEQADIAVQQNEMQKWGALQAMKQNYEEKMNALEKGIGEAATELGAHAALIESLGFSFGESFGQKVFRGELALLQKKIGKLQEQDPNNEEVKACVEKIAALEKACNATEAYLSSLAGKISSRETKTGVLDALYEKRSMAESFLAEHETADAEKLMQELKQQSPALAAIIQESLEGKPIEQHAGLIREALRRYEDSTAITDLESMVKMIYHAEGKSDYVLEYTGVTAYYKMLQAMKGQCLDYRFSVNSIGNCVHTPSYTDSHRQLVIAYETQDEQQTSPRHDTVIFLGIVEIKGEKTLAIVTDTSYVPDSSPQSWSKMEGFIKYCMERARETGLPLIIPDHAISVYAQSLEQNLREEGITHALEEIQIQKMGSPSGTTYCEVTNAQKAYVCTATQMAAQKGRTKASETQRAANA